MNRRWERSSRFRPDAGRARAQDAARPRTAFVLSGGGNQGVSQVGMLRALLERGIVPDVVIGTSAGALNGAAVAYAPNLTGVAQLAAVWEQLQTDHVFPGGRIHRAWNVVRRGTHLFGNDGLAALIHHSTPARSFSDLEIPLRVIATDLDTGEEVVLASRAAEAGAAREHRAARRLPDRAARRAPPRRRRRRQQRAAVARAVGPGRPGLRAQRVRGRRRPRRALAARRRDDELHARAQPALRARAPHTPSTTSTSSISPARATRATSSTSRARTS